MGVSRLPDFYGLIDACVCSGYQALLPCREGPGDEATSAVTDRQTDTLTHRTTTVTLAHALRVNYTTQYESLGMRLKIY